jgi:hypothetical protein
VPGRELITFMSAAARSVVSLATLMTTMVIGVGCGSADTGTVSAHAGAARLVSYERTGGIAGVEDHVNVFAGGAVTVRHRDGAKHHTRLSARRMRALRRAIAAAHFEQPITAGPTSCSDCFAFHLRHDGHTLSFSEVGAPARVNGVLRILTPLADRY